MELEAADAAGPTVKTCLLPPVSTGLDSSLSLQRLRVVALLVFSFRFEADLGMLVCPVFQVHEHKRLICLWFSLLSVFVPVCRVSPANEGGDGGGGRVYLLAGNLRPGKQRLRQLLHQTGALRSQGQDETGQDTPLEKNPVSNSNTESS